MVIIQTENSVRLEQILVMILVRQQPGTFTAKAFTLACLLHSSSNELSLMGSDRQKFYLYNFEFVIFKADIGHWELCFSSLSFCLHKSAIVFEGFFSFYYTLSISLQLECFWLHGDLLVRGMIFEMGTSTGAVKCD